MKAFRHGFVLAGVLAGAAAAARPVDAQQRTQVRDPNAPAIMVLVFRGNEPKAGVEASDAVRERIGREIPIRQLWNIPKDDIVKTLEASGYPTTEPLNANDAKALGTQLRADEYVEGTVTRASGTVKLDARLVLVRDPSLVQPFPSVSASNYNGAASALGKEIKAARAQLDDERDCYRLSREGKFVEAIAAAKKGTAQYARATITRTCELRAMVEMRMKDSTTTSADQILALSNEILAIDPLNKVALANAAEVYKQRGENDKAVAAWSNLIAADPTNTRLVEQVVNEFGRIGEIGPAIPIITQAVSNNPGDPGLVSLAWAVMRAGRQWKEAIRYGEELVQLDTARADTTYFVQLAAAYASDSQPQKASEALARGTAKFPQNAGLWVSLATAQRGAGQNQQAVESLRRALAIDPKAPRARLVMGQLYMDMQQPDSALVAIREGVAAGDDAATLANAGLAFGNAVYQASAKLEDVEAKRAGLTQAMQFLTLSDSLAQNPTTKFLLGVSAFQMGTTYMTEVQAAAKARQNAAACAASRTASDHFATAQINVPPGATVESNRAAAGQIMGAIQQYTAYLDQVKAATCR